jgi:hypothetical protein
MSKSKRKKLLIDELAPSLEERCSEYLRNGLPPDADEFDRVCYQAMANFLRVAANARPAALDVVPAASKKSHRRQK